MVSYFFAVDFEMLTETEGEIVETVAKGNTVSRDALGEKFSLGPDTLDGSLHRLTRLGYLRANAEQEYALANYFFGRWVQETQDRSVPTAAPAMPELVAVTGKALTDSSKKMPAPGLFAELRRRSVFRVGIAYAIVAWLLLQIGEISFDFLEVPIWAGKLLIVFLVLGFPIALILAWAFELTPEGVKRDLGE